MLPAVALGACALAVLACRGGDRPVAFDAGSGFARVTATRAELAAARARLQAAAAAPPADLRRAQAAYDAAYAGSQKALARFLTLALNLAPERPETRSALEIYAGDAIANAHYVLEHDGNRGPALADLGRARRAYEALGLAPPADLTAAIGRLGGGVRPGPVASPAPSPAPRAGAGRAPDRGGRGGAGDS